ncbi:imelysin family protein [Pontibacter liquoris]|uniref:imelysin family protein n=1 Tax=Pontibacter liquoris TaxID=2905677 RepID=UPI001FA7257F|nr:imelysin family protein [Pontibacter liquoris]
MKAYKTYTLAVLTCLATLTGCSSGKEDNGSPKTEYDRQAMLANYSQNLIVPGYQALKTKADELTTAVAAFGASPSATTLATARQAYLEANKAWQDVSTYAFGPADEQLLRSNLNIYPTSASEIEANIAAGTYDLQTSANLDAKGFPALDYLLYSKPTEAEVITLYTVDAQAANRKKYLRDVAGLIKQRAETVYTGWTSDNYADTFQKAAGTAVGSAVGNLVNQLNSDIDLTKRAKVGIPSGRFTAGSAYPEKVEAYYSRNSLELLKRAISAEKAVFMGVSASGTNGPGLDDYLDHVSAKYNNNLLSDAIEAQFDAALAAADAVQGPLSEAVTTQPQAVTKVYDELQKLIVLTKTDMPAALGVTITYTDNDGD